MISTIAMGTRYYYAYKCGILGVILGGDYIGMRFGVILFHMQHVFDPGYVREADDWNYLDASIEGSSLLHIPEYLKWVTLGIEYHHIHHARTRIPGYILRTCHERAPAGLWDAVTVLSYRDMWRSLWLEVWDEKGETFTTFADA